MEATVSPVEFTMVVMGSQSWPSMMTIGRASAGKPNMVTIMASPTAPPPGTAEIAVALLDMQGVEARRAANGREAVDMFEASEPGAFDFVLMDVKMPLLDGLEAAIEIRSLDREDARTVPIIALTANTFQEDREDAAAAGMDGFIPKPFDAQQLYATLRSYLPRKG